MLLESRRPFRTRPQAPPSSAPQGQDSTSARHPARQRNPGLFPCSHQFTPAAARRLAAHEDERVAIALARALERLPPASAAAGWHALIDRITGETGAAWTPLHDAMAGGYRIAPGPWPADRPDLGAMAERLIPWIEGVAVPQRVAALFAFRSGYVRLLAVTCVPRVTRGLAHQVCLRAPELAPVLARHRALSSRAAGRLAAWAVEALRHSRHTTDQGRHRIVDACAVLATLAERGHAAPVGAAAALRRLSGAGTPDTLAELAGWLAPRLRPSRRRSAAKRAPGSAAAARSAA